MDDLLACGGAYKAEDDGTTVEEGTIKVGLGGKMSVLSIAGADNGKIVGAIVEGIGFVKIEVVFLIKKHIKTIAREISIIGTWL